MSQSSAEPTAPALTTEAGSNRLRNLVVAIAAALLGVAMFLGLRAEPNTNLLDRLAQDSIPLDQAIGNGKPTLMEFYADWCTSCQAMAKDLRDLKQDFGDRVNFAMLNVDNSKWLPEVLSYRVDGIPHFVFLDGQGQELAQAIGEQPKTIMAANLTALAEGNGPLPYARLSEGQTSEFSAPMAADEAAEPGKTNPATAGSQGQTDPRSHGAGVVQP